VGLVVELLQFLQGNVGVDLRTGQTGMSQQFLNRTQVRASPQKVGGKRVAQSMGGALPMDSRLLKAFVKDAPHRSCAERSASAIEKKGVSAEGAQRLISEIGRKGILGGFSQHASSLFAPFSLKQTTTSF